MRSELSKAACDTINSETIAEQQDVKAKSQL